MRLCLHRQRCRGMRWLLCATSCPTEFCDKLPTGSRLRDRFKVKRRRARVRRDIARRFGQTSRLGPSAGRGRARPAVSLGTARALDNPQRVAEGLRMNRTGPIDAAEDRRWLPLASGLRTPTATDDGASRRRGVGGAAAAPRKINCHLQSCWLVSHRANPYHSDGENPKAAKRPLGNNADFAPPPPVGMCALKPRSCRITCCYSDV